MLDFRKEKGRERLQLSKVKGDHIELMGVIPVFWVNYIHACFMYWLYIRSVFIYRTNRLVLKSIMDYPFSLYFPSLYAIVFLLI
ncbi:hypothetical protein EDC96DRAFT_492869 [Choanephora cucurbitarum]|nr:hypothetical protein EDC96DRAFT_492869 [Choanephora cucurbitarum]